MDCNSYSYCNMSSGSAIIAETESGRSGYPVIFERCLNWFGDRFFWVYDVFGECEEFSFSGLNPETEKRAYAEAARFYNSLVSDSDMSPLF